MTDSSRRLPLRQRLLWALAGLLVLVFLLVLVRSWMAPDLPPAAMSRQVLPKGCSAHLTGQAGRHDQERTPSGLPLTVVAPLNYQADKRHGVLVLFPPAGFSREMAEHYYQLTTQANTHGYIVVYSNAVALSKRALQLQSEVLPWVMQHWCVDEQRIVFAGHSDGGSVTTGLTVRPASNAPQPSRVVISAAGLTEEDLQQETCPSPLHVTVLHNPQDELFPGFGAGAVRWWGQCMQCSASVQTERSGCQLRQCAQGRSLRFCETTQPHTRWPTVAAHVWEWLD